MITLGIDSGSMNTKGLAFKDGQIAGLLQYPTEFDALAVAQKVRDDLMAQIGAAQGDIAAITATGVGRERVDFASARINEVISAARGGRWLDPQVNMVIDLGAESCRVIKLQADGVVDSYEVNDKCASGAGTFIETMARALQVAVEDMGELSLKHHNEVPMNAQCVVFAESEVVSLIHQKTLKEDIAFAIHKGVCNRINSMVRRVGVVDGVMLIGGTANNRGLLDCLQGTVGKKIAAWPNPAYVSALGAALQAAGVTLQSSGITAQGKSIKSDCSSGCSG
jgi:benzoyl-CoA reductase subunit D